MGEPGIVRKLMVATVTDTAFLKGLRTLWREDLAGAGWRWLAGKCFRHLEEYGEAPGRSIEVWWEADQTVDPEAKESLEGMLADLSDEYEAAGDRPDPQLLLREAQRWFARELYLSKAAELEGAADSGDLERAVEIVERELRPPALVEVSAINPAEHPDLWREAFSEESESLVRLGGALQEQVGTQIVRDSFVAFLGKEKVGKTWLLQAIAFGGVKAGSRVLFCQCGDLSMGQQLRRFGIQLTGRSNRSRYNGPMLSPVPDCFLNQCGGCQRPERAGVGTVIREEGRPYPKLCSLGEADGYRPCAWGCPEFRGSSWWEEVEACDDLEWSEAMGAYQRWSRATGARLRLECFSNKTATVAQVDQRMRVLWEQLGWRPDVVVLDYLDIFAPEPGAPREFRHQEDARWSAARRLSQEWKCAVVTVTQATRDSYKRRLVSEGDSSEDKRKAGHVTGYFGLNRDHHDKRRRWLRINPLYLREDDYDVHDQVTVLQLIQRGRPNLSSFWYRRGSDED